MRARTNRVLTMRDGHGVAPAETKTSCGSENCRLGEHADESGSEIMKISQMRSSSHTTGENAEPEKRRVRDSLSGKSGEDARVRTRAR